MTRSALFLLVGLPLFSQSPDRFELSIGAVDHYSQFSIPPGENSSKYSFKMETLGVAYRIKSEKGNAIRFRYEQGIGSSSETISGSRYDFSAYQEISFDYLRHINKPIYMGFGIVGVKFKTSYFTGRFPVGSPFWGPEETKNELNPQFIIGWQFAKHFSTELHTSFISNASISLRFNF